MSHRSITTTLMGMGFVVMALLMGVSSTALAAGTLTVIDPESPKNDNVNFVAGKTYLIIEWSKGNAGATVKIELLKAGKRTKWITKKTANDGEYVWKIPKSVKEHAKYKIKISSTKNSRIFDTSDYTFTIYNTRKWWKTDFEHDPIGWAEEGGTGNWGTFYSNHNNAANPYHVSVGGGPVRSGASSYRFELRPGDCGHGFPPYSEGGNVHGDCLRGSERVELQSESYDRNGSESWYAWSIYHQNYQFLDGPSVTHGQFKHVKATGSGNKDDPSPGGCTDCLVFFQPRADRGMIVRFENFERYGETILIPKGEINNKWHDILVHAKWSTRSNGLFQVWVNGKLKVNRKGANLKQGNNPIRFKFGVYRSDLYRTSKNYTHIVYYDEVMRGNSCEDVSQFMTCPGGGSLKVTSPNGKEKWKTKKKYTIKWKKGKAGTYVKIQLLKKGKLYRTIAAKTRNDGKHAWKVPSTLVNSAAYKVKISSTKNKKLTDSSDKHFTIKK